MKYLIFLLLTFNAHAMFLKQAEIGNCQAMFYGSMQACGDGCIKQPASHNCEYHEFGEHEVDNLDSPKYTKSETQSCEGQEACQTLLSVKACTDTEESPIMDAEYTEVYCSKQNGYNKMTVVGVYENDAKKDAYLAAVEQAELKQAAMEEIESNMQCGKGVVKELIYRNNVLKDLTPQQKAQVLSQYASIKSLLEVGNLVEAKTLIDNEVADGTLVTIEDKEALIGIIDACLNE